MKLFGLAGLAAAILFSPTISTTAAAQGISPGVSVSAEGQWGFFFADPVLAYYVVPRYTSDLNAVHLSIDGAPSGRVEWGGVAATGAPHVFLRVDTMLSAWRGTVTTTTADVTGVAITYHPASQPSWSGPFGCLSAERCGTSTLSRWFWEVAPGIMIGRSGGDEGGAVWFGARPFYARIGEWSASSQISPEDQYAAYTRERIGMIDAKALGGLFAFDMSIPLARRLAFTADGGVGYYRLNATGETALYEGGDDALGATNPAFLAAMVGGYRAQLGVGFAYHVSPSTEIGLIGRADYWSAYPTLAWPEPDNVNAIATDRLIHLTAGVSVTIRTGAGP